MSKDLSAHSTGTVNLMLIIGVQVEGNICFAQWLVQSDFLQIVKMLTYFFQVSFKSNMFKHLILHIVYCYFLGCALTKLFFVTINMIFFFFF